MFVLRVPMVSLTVMLGWVRITRSRQAQAVNQKAAVPTTMNASVTLVNTPCTAAWYAIRSSGVLIRAFWPRRS